MTLYITVDFQQQVKELAKKNSYANILDDICNFFLDKDIKELHVMRDIIQNSTNTYSLNKFRISNSIMQKGKSGSYRCICACFPTKDIVVLGSIYPKTGSDGIDNLPKQEYKNIAKSIQKALSTRELLTLDFSTGTIKKV